MTETSVPEQCAPRVPGVHGASGAAARDAVSDAIFRQMAHRFMWSPVCLGAGVGLYFAAPAEPGRLVLLAALVLVGFVLGLYRTLSPEPSPVRVTLLGALLLVVAGGNVASLRSHSVAAPVLKFRYYGPVEGRVVAIDRSASQMPRYTLDQVRLSRLAPRNTPIKIRISAHGAPLLEDIRPGDTILTTGHLGPPPGPVEPGSFDFQRHVWFKQLGALGYTRNPVLRAKTAGEGPQSLWLRIQTLRFDLSEVIKSRIGGIEGPFAAAIITGDRSDLDPAALGALRQSNLAHLLAISGLHMGLLTGAVFAVVRLFLSLAPVGLRVDARKIAAISAFLAALAYLGVSGANIATQRAFIMVSVMLLAICLERPALSLRAVALAAFIVLALTPEALFGPGFQMSFAATLALVAVFGGLRDTGFFITSPVMPWVTSLVVSSAVAGAATAPFAAAHFNQIAHYGLLANLLSVPIMGLVVMPGTLIAALGAVLGLDWIGFGIMRVGLWWILQVAEFVSGLEGSTRAVIAPGPWVVPILALGGLVLCLWQGRGRWGGAVIAMAGLGLWSIHERPALLISESGRLVGVLSAEGRVLNKPKGEGFSARVWLENDGDPVTQDIAAARGAMSANVFTISLGTGRLSYDARAPEKLDLPALCRADMVVVPRLDAPLPRGCRGLSGRDFRRDGAIAIRHGPEGYEIQTSRAQQGTRLWGIAAQTFRSRQ